MRGLQTAALIILAVVFLARTPSAVREPRSRLSWLASGAGTLALLTLGTAIPQPVLDGWIGGQNWLNLVQNVLCTVAFWLVTQAAISQDGRRRTLNLWPLLAALAAFTLPFLFIVDRGATDYYFIPHRTGQTAMWLYASIYMATIASISFSLILGVRGRPARAYRFFRIGATIVILACVDEIAYLTIARFDLAPGLVVDVLYRLFDLFFYVGVILIVAGIASFTVVRVLRLLNLRHKLFWLRRVLLRRGFTPPPVEDRSDLLGAVYDHVIAIRDRQAMQQLTLIPAELGLVMRSERIISRHLAGAAPASPDSFSLSYGASS